ncbi:hypothetical protein L2E82_22744 [Cichorium intybus]|uniref:Uncharacterized protein n=1 Tax=Cichorium intybus TaxID=13427 RepID=A0ACB9DZ95_CICIN|nr:hypothetical protein L2E82_22744 [Cichorium intybus]
MFAGKKAVGKIAPVWKLALPVKMKFSEVEAVWFRLEVSSSIQMRFQIRIADKSSPSSSINGLRTCENQLVCEIHSAFGSLVYNQSALVFRRLCISISLLRAYFIIHLAVKLANSLVLNCLM